jgi:hypothetical protein
MCKRQTLSDTHVPIVYNETKERVDLHYASELLLYGGCQMGDGATGTRSIPFINYMIGWPNSSGAACWPAVSHHEKSSGEGEQRAGSAQGTTPSALPCSIAMFRSFSHQPDVPSCHQQRGRPASTGHGDGHFRARAHHWPAVTTPRCTTQPVDAVVASHRAADGASPSIEGARTHAGGISRGAVVRFPVFRSTIWLHRRRAS